MTVDTQHSTMMIVSLLLAHIMISLSLCLVVASVEHAAVYVDAVAVASRVSSLQQTSVAHA